MSRLGAFLMFAVIVGMCIFGCWLGIAMGLDACAQNGSYKHPMLAVEVHCEVRK